MNGLGLILSISGYILSFQILGHAVAGEFTELSQFVKSSKDDIEFVWVTDGQGWKTARLPLSEAFGHIQNVFNLNMLKNNFLRELLK